MAGAISSIQWWSQVMPIAARINAPAAGKKAEPLLRTEEPLVRAKRYVAAAMTHEDKSRRMMPAASFYRP